MAFLSGRIGKAARFEKGLGGYPPFDPPHPGEGLALSEAERAANLDHFLATKDARCQTFIAAAAAGGLALPTPAAVDDVAALSQKLDAFVRSTLSQLRDVERICAPGWRARTPAGREAAIAGFVVDLGIYCGECARQAPLGFDWRIDDTAYCRREAMPTAGCVTLSHRSSRGPTHYRLFHDVLDWTMFQVAQAARANRGRAIQPVNSFAFLGDLTSGRY